MGELLDIFYAGLVIYFIYKLITGLIMPVSRVSSDMRSKIKTMQEEQMRAQKQNNTSAANYSTVEKQKEKVSKDDYIDFEEIK